MHEWWVGGNRRGFFFFLLSLLDDNVVGCENDFLYTRRVKTWTIMVARYMETVGQCCYWLHGLACLIFNGRILEEFNDEYWLVCEWLCLVGDSQHIDILVSVLNLFPTSWIIWEHFNYLIKAEARVDHFDKWFTMDQYFQALD